MLSSRHSTTHASVSANNPNTDGNKQYPASGLQFSFAHPSTDQEIFLERITARDVQHTESGLCTVLLGKEDVPRYAIRRGNTADADADADAEAEEVVVKLHAWKGEKHLGAWEVGTLSGSNIYRIVD